MSAHQRKFDNRETDVLLVSHQRINECSFTLPEHHYFTLPELSSRISSKSSSTTIFHNVPQQ